MTRGKAALHKFLDGALMVATVWVLACLVYTILVAIDWIIRYD